MKQKMTLFVLAVMVVALSVVYAERRGRVSPFTFVVHPLAAYADQVPSGSDYAESPAVMDLSEAPTSLLDPIK